MSVLGNPAIYDNVTGDSLEVGDAILYDMHTWEIIRFDDEDGDGTIFLEAHNLDTGDIDTIMVDPNCYYDLVGE